MTLPRQLKDEELRQKELESYSILDTLPEQDYDDLTTIAAQLCNVPISLISLTDQHRQWFKSHHGIDATEVPRTLAFCSHAIVDPENVFIVPDARSDKRFYDNPLVIGEPCAVFYAGVPLVSKEGYALGTLCVIDHQPRQLSIKQKETLCALSRQVMNLLELRKNKSILEQTLSKVKEKNLELKHFAFIAAHDLKSPLIGVTSMAQLLHDNYINSIDEDGQSILAMLIDSTNRLRGMVDSLLNHSRSVHWLNQTKTKVALKSFINELKTLLSFDAYLQINLITSLEEVVVNKAALDQIMINLVANAIKYNDKQQVVVDIRVVEEKECYCFSVEDNGPGIATKNHQRVFNMFEIIATKDRYGQTGNGIGLATVKKLVEKMGGTISLESQLGEGAKFQFTIPK